MTIEKFETNLVLINMNKLKPYKYMESKVPKKKNQMLVYWEQSVGGVQEVNFDIKEDDEGCQIQKPQMKNDEDKEQITNPTVNIIFIFDLRLFSILVILIFSHMPTIILCCCPPLPSSL